MSAADTSNKRSDRRAQANRIRVLIVDDDRLFAEVMTILLSLDDRIDVVGYAGDGEEGVQLATWLRPDVVLMDVSMPILDGIEATRRICGPRETPRVVVVSGSDSRADMARAQDAGAVAYVTKNCIADELTETIVQVAPAGRPAGSGKAFCGGAAPAPSLSLARGIA